jgi:hypothetical protein
MADEQNTERWLPVVGYEGIYSVSSFGRIRRDKPSQGARVGAIISQHRDGDRYPTVKLSNLPRYKTHYVHILVAGSFLVRGSLKSEVNHKNGDKADNRLDNLEYCTRSENIIHRRDVLGQQWWKNRKRKKV